MGIPIVYFRSSSFNTHRMCPMQFYIEYTLGIRGKGGKKADKGTITHKILEIAALCQKAEQSGIKVINDSDIGEVITDDYTPEYFNAMAARVYEFYTSQWTHHNEKPRTRWREKDFEDCVGWAWKALKYRDGWFDPRQRKIVDVEPHFDITLEEDWAKYEYPEHNLDGYLSLKGTIDLITDVSEEGGEKVYEVVDWKTGQRKDWATGKEYTQANLFDNAQLRMYHYACKHLYPDVSTFLVTIYYINTGGPYTVHFQDSDMDQTIEIIKKKFETIRDTEQPLVIPEFNRKESWKCKTLCDAGKTTFKDTHVLPIVEKRVGQRTCYGDTMTQCEQIRLAIQQKGIDWVTKNYAHPDHIHGHYKAPGSTE